MRTSSAVLCIMITVLLFGSAAAGAQADAWDAVRAEIDASRLREMTLIVGTADGVVFTYSRGAFTPQTVVPIASSTKWLTAAVIMTLVEQGVLALDDHPQDYIDWWTADPADPRSQITLAQLLSFTSGFHEDPRCLLSGRSSIDDCARLIYANWHAYAPGTTYYYSSTHMEIAGLMAQNATGVPFGELFTTLLADPLDMPNTAYLRPSASHPLLAGGAESSAEEYSRFLQALFTGVVLADSRPVMFQDWTAAPVQIAYAPLSDRYPWHYGLGAWRECWAATWTDACSEQMLVSSGGSFGWFPWIDLDHGYYALIARRGLAGSVGESIALAGTLRPLILDALGSAAG